MSIEFQVGRIVDQEILVNVTGIVWKLANMAQDEISSMADGCLLSGRPARDPPCDEISEYWIVTDWLAKKLQLEGEVIELDFFGNAVWGRTTSGQPLSLDAVIQRVASNL